MLKLKLLIHLMVNQDESTVFRSESAAHDIFLLIGFVLFYELRICNIFDHLAMNRVAALFRLDHVAGIFDYQGLRAALELRP
jgi:hypothetical protein